MYSPFQSRPFTLSSGLALMIVGIFACSPALKWPLVRYQIARAFPDVAHISTDELAAWLSDPSRPPPLLLDVRSPEEFALSHIPGALQVCPNAKPEDVLRIIGNRREIVVYCSVGYRSARLASRLIHQRIDKKPTIYNLRGSIFQWANEKRPLVDAHGPASKVHPYDRSWGRLLDPRVRGRFTGPVDERCGGDPS